MLSKYPIMVFCNTPDKITAEMLATKALTLKLAACATILGDAVSLYYWQGKLIKNKEIQILLKSDSLHQEQLFQLLKELHPYEIPELLSLPIDGENQYLSWLHSSMKN